MTNMVANAAHLPADSDIAGLREQIDTVDRELVALIDRRLELARSIGQAKGTATAMPVVQPDREREVMAHIERHGLAHHAERRRAVWQGIIAASRAVQTEPAGWSLASWRGRAAAQQPSYPDASALAAVEAELAAAPPVTSLSAARRLRTRMTNIAMGRGFCVQAGDCAEPVAVSPRRVSRDIALLQSLATGVRIDTQEDVAIIARMAGQYAKPRSSATEIVDGVELPVYRGDAVNTAEADVATRTADPYRMLTARRAASATARLVGALDLPGAQPVHLSHEALLLGYEQASMVCDETGRHWSGSADMLWIGDRTRQIDGAHVEFVRGIGNVVGVKVGPTMTTDELCRLVEAIDPGNEVGRLILIGRFGAEAIGRHMPALVAATRRMGSRVIWMSDPMHGNTESVDSVKTRRMDAMRSEIVDAFAIAAAENTRICGVHLETTGADVVECLDEGSDTLIGRYTSLCDPRLNPDQAVALAGLIAGLRRRYAL